MNDVPDKPLPAHLQRKAQKQARKQLGEIFKRIDRAAHQMLDELLEKQMPDIVMHCQKGRGFRLHIEIVNANGTPWVPETVPRAEAEERLIIMPHEQ